MIEEYMKFPAVMTLESVLGLEEGTVLRFDPFSGKYVSIEEDEDIAADEYYYSGSAVAIDPYIVKDNLGSLFTQIESVKENDKVSDTKEMSSDSKEDLPVSGERDPEEERIEEKTEESIEKEPSKNFVLVTSCKCGCRSYTEIKVTEDQAGISAVIMADDETSFIKLNCDYCGAELKLHFIEDNREQFKEEDK